MTKLTFYVSVYGPEQFLTLYEHEPIRLLAQKVLFRFFIIRRADQSYKITCCRPLNSGLPIFSDENLFQCFNVSVILVALITKTGGFGGPLMITVIMQWFFSGHYKLVFVFVDLTLKFLLEMNQ